MCDVRKAVGRFAGFGLAVALAAGTVATAQIQATTQIAKRPVRHARRETNASREARIAKTIAETYAQKYEIFGGGGYLRFRAGEYLKKNNEINWNVNTSYYFNPKWAVVGSAQGSFGSARAIPDNIYSVPKAQINEYYFMAGPSYRFYAKEKFAVSAVVQAGVGWGIFGGGSKSIPPTDLGLWNDETRMAFSAGVNGDYNLYPNLALRLTPMYMPSIFGGKLQNNVGFNAGVLYRFGKQ